MRRRMMRERDASGGRGLEACRSWRLGVAL
jgi:hypothetical protein